MNIGIDIDYTLTEPISIKDLAKSYIKDKNLPYKLVNENAFSIIGMYDWGEEDCRKFYLDNTEDIILKAPVKINASTVVSKLKEQGNKIYIITARSKAWCGHPYKYSEEWLQKNKIPFDELLIEHYDKTDACLKTNVKCFIDDSVFVLNNLKKISLDTIMMQSEFNVNDYSYQGRRAKDWLEVESHLKELNILM